MHYDTFLYLLIWQFDPYHPGLHILQAPLILLHDNSQLQLYRHWGPNLFPSQVSSIITKKLKYLWGDYILFIVSFNKSNILTFC
jgi:hypothetical protein